MNWRISGIALMLGLALVVAGCAQAPAPPAADAHAKPAGPPEPTVTHTTGAPGENVDASHGEVMLSVTEEARQRAAQHHTYKVLETRRVPGPFSVPEMKDVKDFALSKSDLDVIHPGPGEYVHVMEGQRHGYQNLTIGITWTAPGGAPPMHTHRGEESHVLLSGQKIMYALGDKLFVKEGPYMVNIPPGVPHCFTNLDSEVAELVVIFPTNVWEYDVVDYFPFNTPEAKKMMEEARKPKS